MSDSCPQCKIIIDGNIMKARLKYAIDAIDFQEKAVGQFIESRVKLTDDETEKLLVLSDEQCDFSKLVEAQANKTLYLLSHIAAAHARST